MIEPSSRAVAAEIQKASDELGDAVARLSPVSFDVSALFTPLSHCNQQCKSTMVQVGTSEQCRSSPSTITKKKQSPYPKNPETPRFYMFLVKLEWHAGTSHTALRLRRAEKCRGSPATCTPHLAGPPSRAARACLLLRAALRKQADMDCLRLGRWQSAAT